MSTEKTGEFAPYAPGYEPPELDQAMGLAGRIAVAGAERSMSGAERGKLLVTLRRLLEHSDGPVFAIERNPRDKRSVQAQDHIFRLNRRRASGLEPRLRHRRAKPATCAFAGTASTPSRP